MQVKHSEDVIAALCASSLLQQPGRTGSDQAPRSLTQPHLSEACQAAPRRTGEAQAANALGVGQPEGCDCKSQQPVYTSADASAGQSPGCGRCCASCRSRDMPACAQNSYSACGRNGAPSADSAGVQTRAASAAAEAAHSAPPAHPGHARIPDTHASCKVRQCLDQSRDTQSAVGAPAAEAAGGRRLSTKDDATPPRLSSRQTGSQYSDATRPRSQATAARRTCRSSELSSAARRNTAPGRSEGSTRSRTVPDRRRPVAAPRRHTSPTCSAQPRVVVERRRSGLPATDADAGPQPRTGKGWDSAPSARQLRSPRTTNSWIAESGRRAKAESTAAQPRRALLNSSRRASTMAASRGTPVQSPIRPAHGRTQLAPTPKSRSAAALCDILLIPSSTELDARLDSSCALHSTILHQKWGGTNCCDHPVLACAAALCRTARICCAYAAATASQFGVLQSLPENSAGPRGRRCKPASGWSWQRWMCGMAAC